MLRLQITDEYNHIMLVKTYFKGKGNLIYVDFNQTPINELLWLTGNIGRCILSTSASPQTLRIEGITCKSKWALPGA